MSRTSTISNSTLFDGSFYVGINLQGILYGIQLALYFKTIRILLVRRTERQKSDVFYGVFSSVMLFLVTFWLANHTVYGQEMWLLNPNYPGGPDAYVESHKSEWNMELGMAAIIILQQMTDALMMYRCLIVWGGFHALIMPAILWLANLTLGILISWDIAMQRNSLFDGIAAKFGLAYYSGSVFLNTTLTYMICYRLVGHARTVMEYLGAVHASPYFTMLAFIVESVLPYTLSGVAFLVAYGVGNETRIAFLYVYALMTGVSSQMLILRVVEGKAWQKDTMIPPASVIVSRSGAECSNESRAVVLHSVETLPRVPYHLDMDDL